MNFRLEISNAMKLGLVTRLQQAYQKCELRLVKRIHALHYLADGYALAEISQILEVCEQTLRNYVKTFQRVGQPEVCSSPRTPRQIEQDPKEGVGCIAG